MAVKGNECNVHFIGWKARYDEWISLNSGRLVEGPMSSGSFVEESLQQQQESVPLSSSHPVGSCVNASGSSVKQDSSASFERRALHGDNMLQTPLQPKLLGSIAGRAVSTDVGSGGVVIGMLDSNVLMSRELWSGDAL